MQAWGITYWNRVETGAVSTVTFSNPAMNSHLFNPFRGTRATLERLKLLDASDCDKAIIESDPSALDAATLAKRQALKDAMTAAKFATDAVANGQGTAEHIVKILDAAATSQVVTYEEGGKLVSQKLPLDVLVAAGADPQLATELSTETMNAINAIVVAAPGYASTATGCTEAQKMLTGGVSRADQVEARVRTLLSDTGNAQAETYVAYSSFGVDGELPVVNIYLLDAVVLVDGVTGSVAGPYKRGEPVSSVTLLSAHPEYSAAFGTRTYSGHGCLRMAATVPHDTVPPAPWGLQPPIAPSTTPGNPDKWQCENFDTAGRTECRCSRSFTYVHPGPPATTMKVEWRCTKNGACTSFSTLPPGCTMKYFW